MNNSFDVKVIIKLIDKFSNPMAKIAAQSEKLNRIGGGLQKAGLGLMAFSGAAVLAGKPFVTAASQVQGYQTQLEVMLGSTEKAIERFNELQNFSNITPFDMPEVIEFGNQLQAVGKYSVSLMTDLGNLASGAGKPLRQVTSAYAKLASGQKGMAVDMFRDLLISTNDWQKALGKEVKNATAEEMMKVLPEIINEQKKFGGMMEKQSQTFAGAVSNMKGAMFRFKSVIGKPLLKPLTILINKISGAINKVTEWAEKNPKVINTISKLAGVLTVITGAVGGFLFNIGTATKALSFISTKFGKISRVAKKFFLFMNKGGKGIKVLFTSLASAGPVGWILLAIAAAITQIVIISKIMYKNWTKVKKLWNEIPGVVKPLIFMFAPLTSIAFGIVSLIKLIEKRFGSLKNFLKTVFTPVSKMIKMQLKLMGMLGKVFIASFKPAVIMMKVFGKTFKMIFKTVWNIAKPIFKKLNGKILNLFMKIPGFKNFVKGLQSILGLFKNFNLDQFLTNVEKGFNVIAYKLGSVAGTFEAVSYLINAKSDKISNSITNAFKMAGKTIANFLINPVNLAIRGINKVSFKMPFGKNKGETIGFNLEEIPSFNKGVRNFSGGLAYVHKDEMISLPKGSNVYTKGETKNILTGKNRRKQDNQSGGNITKIFKIGKIEINPETISQLKNITELFELLECEG